MIPQIYYVLAIAAVLVGASWHISASLTALSVKMEAVQTEVAKVGGSSLVFAEKLGGLDARVTLLERNKQ